MKKHSKLALKIAVSFGLLYLVISSVDRNSLVANFSKINYSYTLIIVLMFLLNYFLSSLRWENLLLIENKTSYFYFVKLYFIGSFFNNFMPTSIGGDVYKVFRLGKKIENNSAAFASTFMERFTGVVALVLISYFGLTQTIDFWLGQLPQFYLVNANFVFLFKFLLFGGFWIVSFLGYLVLRALATKIPLLDSVYGSLNKYKEKPNVLVSAVITSFLVQFVAILSHWFVLKAMGIDVSFVYALFVFPVIFLAGFFIPSLNGLGVQDVLYVQFFQHIAGSSAALSASVVYHFFRLFVSLIGGVLYAFEKSD